MPVFALQRLTCPPPPKIAPCTPQLLGFTRYYTIILEHSKTSIAGAHGRFDSPELPCFIQQHMCIACITGKG
jgi:hypothetical protein